MSLSAKILMQVFDEAVAMRQGGATKAATLEHCHDRVMTWARSTHGAICADADLPPWFLRGCDACQDSGWRETTRQVRGESVPAAERCSCKPQAYLEDGGRLKRAAKVVTGWSRR